MNIFKKIKDRLMPMKIYGVQMEVVFNMEDRVIANFPVTVEARTKFAALARARKEISVRPGRAIAVKKKLNGTQTSNV
jgi:hypothetical protein